MDDAEGTVKDARQGGQCRRHCPTRSAPWMVPDKELATCAVTVVTVQQAVLKKYFSQHFHVLILPMSHFFIA